ncbi:hypothetical protein ACWDA3_23645 [Nonomuraea rubra]
MAQTDQRYQQVQAAHEAFGVAAGMLNGDRIGRALDAIAPHLDHLAGTIGLAVIEAFGLEVTRLHWDMTLILLHGHYRVPLHCTITVTGSARMRCATA